MIELRSLVEKLNPKTRKAIELAASNCHAARHYDLEVEHFLLVLLEPGTELWRGFTDFQLDPHKAKRELEAALAIVKTGNSRVPAIGWRLLKLLEIAWQCTSLKLGWQQISSGTVWLGLLAENMPREHLAGSEFCKIGADRLAKALPEIARAATESPLPAPPPSAAPAPAAAESELPRVFLSYRRSDTETMAQTLYYCLAGELKGIEIFRDNNSLEPGEVFAEVIRKNIAACDVLIMLIGKKWLKVKDKEGRLRLNDAADFVRLEIAEALSQRKKVFPCLIDGARMPSRDDLPADLHGLTERHATALSTTSFHRDVEPLVSALRRFKR